MANLLVEMLTAYVNDNNFLAASNYVFNVFLIKTDLITNFYLLHFSNHVSPVFLTNYFILCSWILSVLFCYLFLIRIIDTKCWSLVFSIIYSSSLYFIFRNISFTPALAAIYIFPLILLITTTQKKIVLLPVLWISLGLSNYYGFFNFILLSLYYLVFSKGVNFVRNYLINMVIIFIAGLSFVIVTYNSLIFSFPILSYYKKPNPAVLENVFSVYRPIQDYYSFSFRPWYFLIPPKSSVFFGDLSKNLYQKISDTGYYLAQNYTEDEMAGSYMGWHFILGSILVAILLLLKKFKNKEYPVFQNVYKNRVLIFKSFLMIFLILLISGPPSISINGFEIYTPTYLLYYIVPVFRTLVRWAVVIYLFVLIINSFLVMDLYNLMKNKIQKAIFIVLFLFLNFVIFAVQIPVKDISNPPSEISYLKNLSSEGFPYAVYPKGDYYSIFWILSHEKYLLNPRDFKNTETGFDSNDFSKSLNTSEGLEELKNINGHYLIFYPSVMKEEEAINTEQFFNQSPLLTKIENFENEPYQKLNLDWLNKFIQVNDVDGHTEAIIYKVN